MSTNEGLPDSTEQNPQFLVQRSPNIMNVAVGFEKQKYLFGHLASSHTVESL
jgi:hypothetical protein